MTHLYYADNLKQKRKIDMTNADANTYYLNHYQISLLLRATAKNARDFTTRNRANDEIVIAERKMTFWERHKNFDISQILNDMMRLKRADFSQVCCNL